ncbi:hypothetical protein EsDP_00002346 [Epichloe bromicola]|uniref:Xylanolytic transcriptional activator regulatory domain-containing protein n=1 Tax=Epichloe bromicola TaxID=79588 RepID=A0ABQ0CKH7_9HYPO
MLVRRNILLKHVDAYMDNMYWLPCQGFLHPETTYREIQEGLFDPVVAAAVCGITSVFISPSDSGGEFGVKCSAFVEMYLFHNIYRFSDDLLVLFSLSITFNLIRGEFAKVWQSFGVASRLMLGLRVNWDVLPRNQSFAQQESLRRIAWQLFYLDRMLAGGTTKRLCGIGSSSSQSQLDASRIMADINGLQNELTRFHMSLPPEVLLSDQTVTKYMASPERAGYVFLHTHLAISHIDLYRFSLPGQRDKISADILRRLPREFIARSQKQAVAHAMSLGRFCDAIQTEVDQMQDTGKLELAGDYSTFQMATHCVRVLLIALQYKLYRDINDVTTAPLWRAVEVDEAHIRFLIDSVQRVTRPWCSILGVAQQAYEHNAALVEEFDMTRKVADQRATESMFSSKSGGSGRLPGPDIILESIATGKFDEDEVLRVSSQNPSDSTQWMRAHPSPPGPNFFATQADFPAAQTGGNAPGIPSFLAQARSKADNVTQVPLMYDTDNSMMPMMPMGDLDAVLPATHPVQPVLDGDGSSPLAGPPMFQQPIPQPSAGFLMAQQSIFGGDAYAEHYMNRQHAQGDYSHHSGGY